LQSRKAPTHEQWYVFLGLGENLSAEPVNWNEKESTQKDQRKRELLPDTNTLMEGEKTQNNSEEAIN